LAKVSKAVGVISSEGFLVCCSVKELRLNFYDMIKTLHVDAWKIDSILGVVQRFYTSFIFCCYQKRQYY